MSFVPFRPRWAAPRHLGAEVRASAYAKSVTVTPGACLWSIAQDHLGTAATDWEIAHEWPRWHRANWQIIGEDPANLPAGTVLAPPASSNAGPNINHLD